MNLKKIILLFIITLFLSGCADVTYNLDISKNLKVSEDVFITGTSEYFSNFYMDYPLTIVKEFYNDKQQLEPLDKANYEYELKEDAKYPGIKVFKSYDSLEKYSEDTVFKGQVFSAITCDIKDNIVTLNANGYKPYDEGVTYGYAVSKVNVNIKVPYVVTSNNADNYDNKTNTYTWVINEETKDKEIKITFDKNRIYVYNLVMYISITILIILGIIAGVIIFKLVKKNRRNNSIYE